MRAAVLKTFGEVSDNIILFNENALPYYLSPTASGFFRDEGSNDKFYEALVNTLHLVSESKLQLTYRVRLQAQSGGPVISCSVAKFGRGYRVVMEDSLNPVMHGQAC